MTQRNTAATLEWYPKHNTTAELGFNPNGMCMKICRTARNLGPMYPSALASQLATPLSKRITKLNDIKRGMVMYFDDPNDNNPFGHIVTVAGRAAPVVSSLNDLIVWTNSVSSGRVIRVRGDYFPKHWGDEFQFAATWLNGQDLLLPGGPLGGARGDGMRRAIREIRNLIAYHESKGHPRLVTALKRDLEELRQTLRDFD